MLVTKKIPFSIFIFLLFSLGGLSAQPENSLVWHTNAEEAFILASDESKPVFLLFSGSDWCKPCMRMRETVLESSAFIVFAADQLVLLQADFPRNRKNRLSSELASKNDLLAAKYNPQGVFPLVVLLDPSGKQLHSSGYQNESPERFIARLSGWIASPDPNP